MEARQTLRGSAFPKALLMVLALCAAVLLAVGASYIGRGATGSGSIQSSVHPAPFTVLRQDYQGPTGTTVVRHKSVEQMPGYREN